MHNYFVENFHVNNLVLEIFMRLIFMGQGYPRKLFNFERFPIYGMYVACMYVQYVHMYVYMCNLWKSCMCMYVSMHVCIYVCIYICMTMHMNVCTYLQVLLM